MSKVILDASALLAYFNSEKGGDVVEELLSSSIMSTVNIAEVIAELDSKLDISSDESKNVIIKALYQIVPFDFAQCALTGHLKKMTRNIGLSLGDRACIALGISTGYPIYTADKVWSEFALEGVEIRLIR